MKYSYVNHFYRITDDDHEAFIEVGKNGDGGLIEIRTTTEYSQQYYGQIRLPLTKELAKLLGETLIKAAQEM